MHRNLTHFGNIFNEIIMKILDVGTWYELFGLNCQKGKIYGYLLMYFSFFGSFWVWGLIVFVRESLCNKIFILEELCRYSNVTNDWNYDAVRMQRERWLRKICQKFKLHVCIVEDEFIMYYHIECYIKGLLVWYLV